MVHGHETYKVKKRKGRKINPWPPKLLEKVIDIVDPQPRFNVTPYEHGHFQDWYRDLDPELKELLEKKGMPTEVFLEKLWVSGFRAGHDSAPREPMRIGPPSP